jgi:general stress protein 26
MKKFENAIKLMTERFSKDSFIAVATVDNGRPYVRTLDGYYHEGAFYFVTYALSNKMKQIAKNPDVAVCTIDWFSGHGVGENLGHVLKDSNAAMMELVRKAFESWYTGGHVDESNKNTCLLKITLKSGTITDHETKYGERFYKVDFANKKAK